MTKWNMHNYKKNTNTCQYAQFRDKVGQMMNGWYEQLNIVVWMVQMLQCQMPGFPILRKCYVTGMNVVMADYWAGLFVDEQDCLSKMTFGWLVVYEDAELEFFMVGELWR